MPDEVKITYKCKGPRFTKEEVAAARAAQAERLKTLVARLEDPKQLSAAQGEQYIIEAKRIHEQLAKPPALLDLRHGCAEDMTPHIEAIPEDGTNYLVPCPKCGTVTEVNRKPGLVPAGA